MECKWDRERVCAFDVTRLMGTRARGQEKLRLAINDCGPLVPRIIAILSESHVRVRETRTRLSLPFYLLPFRLRRLFVALDSSDTSTVLLCLRVRKWTLNRSDARYPRHGCVIRVTRWSARCPLFFEASTARRNLELLIRRLILSLMIKYTVEARSIIVRSLIIRYFRRNRDDILGWIKVEHFYAEHIARANRQIHPRADVHFWISIKRAFTCLRHSPLQVALV